MKYGLLIAYTENIGDDIQSLAAKQYLPRVDVYLDRDNLDKILVNDQVKLIMNGWFTHNPNSWPPPHNLIPLFVSFHISPKIAKKLLTSKTIEYLKRNEPIGTRDTYTETILKQKGVKSYFSGCLTLTLDYKYSHYKKTKSNKILLVDLDKDAFNLLPSKIVQQSTIISHYHYVPRMGKLINIMSRAIPHAVKKSLKHITLHSKIDKIANFIDSSFARQISIEERLNKAENLIKEYAQASLVITSRLHAALPSVSFGTPVIFVHRNPSDQRFSGLLEYMNHYSLREFKRTVTQIDWEYPPENPNRESLEDLKKNLVRTVKEFIREIYP